MRCGRRLEGCWWLLNGQEGFGEVMDLQSPQHSDSPAAKRPSAAAHWPQGPPGCRGREGRHAQLAPLQPVCPSVSGRADGKHAAAKEPFRLGPWCFGMRKEPSAHGALPVWVRGGEGMQYWFNVTKAGRLERRGEWLQS